MHPFTKHSDALLHPEGQLPNAPALAVAVATWTRKQTGVMLGPVSDTVVLRGEPLTPEGLAQIVRAIYSGSLVFRARELGERPTAKLLGPHLYEAGRRLADQGLLLRHPTALLHDAPGIQAARRLPLHPVTRARLARRPEGGTPIGPLLAGVAVDQAIVFQDLAVLLALGLLQLAIPVVEAPEAPDPDPVAPPRRRARDVLARRLRRDWQRMESLDDWGVLGVTPAMDDAALDRACDRMLLRYSGLVSDANLEPEARDLARLLHRRVGEAAARIRPEEA